MANTWITFLSRCTRFYPLAVVVLTIAIAGCGSKNSNLAPVRGTVTIDGQPMTWGRVQFAPVATEENRFPGRPAFGWIEADGTFILGTDGTDDGAVVGQHRVTIDRRNRTDGNEQRPGSDLKFDKLQVVGTFDVQPGMDNDIAIELTSQFVKQHGEIDD